MTGFALYVLGIATAGAFNHAHEYGQPGLGWALLFLISGAGVLIGFVSREAP